MPTLQATAKRSFDLLASFLGILVVSPLLWAIALAVGLTSSGPILFRQTRMGRRLKPFQILKFRTMVENASQLGLPLTAGDDPRITRVGKFLRKTKLDELPQLLNVLKGDMSLVGPRPEVPKYVEMFPDDFAEILIMRPGLTDLASIKYETSQPCLIRRTTQSGSTSPKSCQTRSSSPRSTLEGPRFSWTCLSFCKRSCGSSVRTRRSAPRTPRAFAHSRPVATWDHGGTPGSVNIGSLPVNGSIVNKRCSSYIRRYHRGAALPLKVHGNWTDLATDFSGTARAFSNRAENCC